MCYRNSDTKRCKKTSAAKLHSSSSSSSSSVLRDRYNARLEFQRRQDHRTHLLSKEENANQEKLEKYNLKRRGQSQTNPSQHTQAFKELQKAPRQNKDSLKKIVTTKQKGTKERLSAAAYIKKYGPDTVGHVCDIRDDGELKCLVLDKNGRPYWAKKSKNGTKAQEVCGNWEKNCFE
jgi:hypothetical protein